RSACRRSVAHSRASHGCLGDVLRRFELAVHGGEGMSRLTSLFASMAALASLSLTAACGAPSPEDDASTGGTSGNTGGATGSGGRDAAVDPPLCEGGNCDGALSMCANSVSGWATLRRLTVREFRSLISATFPEIEGSWQSSLSPDSVSRTGFD